MLKSDLTQNQIGGSINVARNILESDLINKSIVIIEKGPSQIFRSTIELICEVIQNIPTCVTTMIEKNIFNIIGDAFNNKNRILKTEELSSICYFFYILEFHNFTKNLINLDNYFDMFCELLLKFDNSHIINSELIQIIGSKIHDFLLSSNAKQKD
jgi:hypothetical protein